MAALLKRVADQQLSVEDALGQLDDPGFVDLDYAKVDTDRQQRTGYPEVIYGEGKTAAQIIGIIHESGCRSFLLSALLNASRTASHAVPLPFSRW